MISSNNNKKQWKTSPPNRVDYCVTAGEGEHWKKSKIWICNCLYSPDSSQNVVLEEKIMFNLSYCITCKWNFAHLTVLEYFIKQISELYDISNEGVVAIPFGKLKKNISYQKWKFITGEPTINPLKPGQDNKHYYVSLTRLRPFLNNHHKLFWHRHCSDLIFNRQVTWPLSISSKVQQKSKFYSKHCRYIPKQVNQ